MLIIKSKTITYLKDGRIKGKVKLSDKSVTKFEIGKDGEWHQWGNTTDNLFVTVPLVEQLAREII
jgi:hypothetical protein